MLEDLGELIRTKFCNRIEVYSANNLVCLQSELKKSNFGAKA